MIDRITKLFLQYLKSCSVSEKTYRDYKSDLALFTAWLIFKAKAIGADCKNLQEALPFITKSTAEEYKKFLIANNTPAPTLNRRLSTIRTFSKFLFENQFLTFEFAQGVKNISRAASLSLFQKNIKEFASFLEVEKASPLTIKNYISDIGQFLRWIEKTGKKEINQIISKDIKRYLIIELAYAPQNTKDRKIASLKKFFSWAIQEKKINYNPVEKYLEETTYIKPIQESLSEISDKDILRRVSGIPPSYQPWKEKITAYLAGKPRLQKFVYNLLYTRPKWYITYHSLAFTRYLHLAVLIVFAVALGFGAYQQLFSKTQTPVAYPTQPTPPKRYLSFQGRLTNQYNTPITTATQVVFKLYDAATGGNVLWNSSGISCTITPDQDGIFSILLGTTSGDGYTCTGISAIDASVFSENPEVWLGVKVGTDAEATPRIQIATVAYALNAETLQGYPIDATGSATKNTVLTMNSGGEVILAEVGPKIKSVSGNFSIQGEAITLQASGGSVAGDITLSPASDGTVSVLASGTTNDSLYIQNAQITSGALIHGYYGGSATDVDLLKLGAGATESTKFLVESSGDTFLASGADLYIGGIGLNDNSNLSSGASLIGLYDDSMTYISGNTNVQSAIKQLDTAIGTISGSAGGWTDDGSLVRLTTSSDRVGIGTTSPHSSTKLGILGNVAIGSQTYSDAQAPTNGLIVEGSVGIGTTNPSQKLSVAGTLGILEGGASPTYYTIFQGGDQTANITYTLPTSVVANGFLTTDASGVLSWTTTIPATSVAWSNLTNPTANLSLNHNEYTTLFTWDTAATAGSFTGLTLSLTNDAGTDTNTQRILALQNNSATGGTTENLLYLNNADNDAVTTAIQIATTGGGGFTNLLDTPSIDISGGGAITGATGITSSGTITFSGLTANRLVATDGSSNLTTSISSSNVAASVTDETGTGNLVFNISPSFTTSVDASSTSFSVFNTTATTINAFGAATTLNMGASSGTATINNATLSLPNATSVNIAGASSVINLSSTTGVKQITTGGTTNLALMPGGNVGIGTINPSSFKLQVAGDLGPDIDNSYDLGSPSLRWRNIYGVNIYGNITPTGFTPGSVIFAGSGGTLSQNNSQFFWDDANYRLGIGTTSPTGKLTITAPTSALHNILSYKENLVQATENTYHLGIHSSRNLRSAPSIYITEARNSLSAIYRYVSADSAFWDETRTLGEMGGSTRTTLENTSDILYFGRTSGTFSELYFDIYTAGAGYTLVWEYWDGSSWTSLTVTDNTSGFSNNGWVTWTAPGNWATTTVGPDTTARYYVRVRTTTTPTTTATAYYANIGGFSSNFLQALSQDRTKFYVDTNGQLVSYVSEGRTPFVGYRDDPRITELGGYGFYYSSQRNIDSAVSYYTNPARSNLDNIYFYDGASSSFTNRIANREWGASSFSLNDATNDYLYLGDGDVFSEVYFDITTPGVGYTLVFEYSAGSGVWNTLTVSDGTNAFSKDGWVFWSIPGSWATETVNGVSKYWIRIKTTSTPTTTAAASFVNISGFSGHLARWYAHEYEKFRVTNRGSLFLAGLVYPGTAADGGSVQTTNYIAGNTTGIGIGTTNPSQKLSVAGTLGILEGGASPTYYTIFQGGDQTANITYTLPTSVVANGFLTTDASGVLSWTTTLPSSPVAWSNLTDPTANLSLNHGTYTTTFNTSVSTGTFFTINANSLTSGKGLYLSSTSTGLTGNLAEIVLSGSNTANTGNLLRIAQTGTSSAAIPLMITNLGTGYSFRVNDETGDNDTTPFIIDSSGKVGVGVTSVDANAKMQVNGDIAFAGILYVPGGGYQLSLNTGNTVMASNLYLAGSNPIIAGTYDTSSYQTIVIKGSDDNSSTSLCVEGTGTGNNCDGKIDAGTVDPPYTINGKKYATFMPSMTGVKEETTGKLITEEYIPGFGYRKIINFSEQEEGNDLWLFSKVSNLKENIDKMTVLLTPDKNTKVWYKINRESLTLEIYSSQKTEISYRLTAPRFDYQKWSNRRKDDESIGFIINDPDIKISSRPQNISFNYPIKGNNDALFFNGDMVKFQEDNKSFKLESEYSEEVLAANEIFAGQAHFGYINAKNIIIDANVLSENVFARNTIKSERIKANLLEIADNLQSKIIKAKEIIVDKIYALQAEFDNLLIKTGLISPSIKTANISPLDGQTNINVQFQDQGKFSIQNQDGNEVASINSEGKITSKTIETKEIAVEEELKAGKINAEDITAQKIYADRIVAKDGTIFDLSTANLGGVTMEQIERLLREAEADQKLLQMASDWNIETASQSAKLANIETANIQNLFVTKSAAFNSLSVSNSLALGTDFVISANSDGFATTLNSLSAPLSIQSLALAPVEIMAGKLRIETNGDVYIQGNLYVAGNITSQGIKITTGGIDSDSLQTTAEISASGSAEFKEVVSDKFIIAGASVATDSAQITDGKISTNATTGSAVIPAGMKEVEILSPAITSNTLIYITPTSDTKNYVLYVKAKEEGRAVVGFNRALDISVTFNWWVIKVKN